MAASPLDALLATFDRHIDSTTAAQRTAASSVAGPSSLALRRDEIRNLIAPTSPSPTSSASLQLSPLERAIYYEVENRRNHLQRKSKELDFWEAYETELAEEPMKMPTSTSALSQQIEEKKQRLRELEAQNRLKTETAKALESSAVIQKVLSTTSPPSSDSRQGDEGAGQEQQQEQYASTRKLLEQRDDQALEFLKIFNDIQAIKRERIQVKARIRDQRAETMKLLENIKNVKADIRNRQLRPSSGSAGQQDSDASQQDIAVVQKVQQMQREINEARSKKELVKGILRGLILESGRDWTKNTSTRALMLSLDDEDDASDDAFSEDEEEGREEGDDDEIDEDEEDLEELEDEE
ncbi:uncharacterized protein UTRI_04480_B [Ustilago trichophora]|uniref:Uncharacterized protein n=1 Tax=Ustilago trichophora TaxID=86804 RepID=A0A5C3ED01_9BASI|nr:uncharacterized protein UTRI_04480_B [Ustilago trichophora]